jgi:hypothetical protein
LERRFGRCSYSLSDKMSLFHFIDNHRFYG